MTRLCMAEGCPRSIPVDDKSPSSFLCWWHWRNLSPESREAATLAYSDYLDGKISMAQLNGVRICLTQAEQHGGKENGDSIDCRTDYGDLAERPEDNY